MEKFDCFGRIWNEGGIKPPGSISHGVGYVKFWYTVISNSFPSSCGWGRSLLDIEISCGYIQ